MQSTLSVLLHKQIPWSQKIKLRYLVAATFLVFLLINTAAAIDETPAESNGIVRTFLSMIFFLVAFPFGEWFTELVPIPFLSWILNGIVWGSLVSYIVESARNQS